MDYGNIARRAMRKDLQRAGLGKSQRPPNGMRVKQIEPTSAYYQYRRCIIGKLVRVREETQLGKWYEFVHDEDRRALNTEAGWSDSKEVYMFGNIKTE